MTAARISVLLLLAVEPAFALAADSRTTGSFGEVSFANSGAPAAQQDFLSGLALLHDFEYPAAADAFRRAQATDPGFAMAYWGEAMTFNHPVWMQQDLASARAALNRLAPSAAGRRAKAPTPREKEYLDALEQLYGAGSAGTDRSDISDGSTGSTGSNGSDDSAAGEDEKAARDRAYAEAMARLHERYPGDVDATAFFGLALLGTAHAGRDVATYMRAAGLLEEAWVSHRDHPGLLHYLIHCYDDPAHAPLGLRAARLYSRIAPDAGHAVHMTSHIFLALGMWRETVDTNLAAMAAVNRMRAAHGKEPARCGHYVAWLAYAYLQLGETDRAKSTLAACREAALAERASEEPGHAMDADDSLGSAFANLRLGYLLESGDDRGEVAEWPLPPVANPGARLDFAFARALGEIARGTPEGTRLALADLETVGQEVAAVVAARRDPNPTDRVRPEIFGLEAQGLLAERNGDLAGAEKLFRQAVVLEDGLPIAFGPPEIEQPTHELLGAFLLRHGRRAEARAEFVHALALAPGRRLAAQGLAATTP